jgi:hypothetical protein
MNLAFNVIGVAPGLQEIGTVVAAVTCWGLFFDEINKFLWWPLHLSGYVLVVVPIPLLVGLYMLRASRVTVSVGPAWVPAVLAGLLILVVTFRARSRIDSYGGVCHSVPNAAQPWSSDLSAATRRPKTVASDGGAESCP